MKRDAVLSIIIGALATYLPFWEWSNTFTQITGAIVIAMLTFYFLVGTEKDSVKRQLKQESQKIIEQPYCKAD